MDIKKIRDIAEKIRTDRNYNWVGIYKVADTEIVAVAWTGTVPPTHPRFSVTQGLCGSAVTTKKPVIVGDVKKDPRYLTTFGDTRSEIIVPLMKGSSSVIALVDAASDHFNAFDNKDAQFLEGFGAEILSALSDSNKIGDGGK